MNTEKIKHHIEALQEKHRKLDTQIGSMESAGSFKDEDVQLLKKEKLRIKDEIEQFEHRIGQ